MPSERRPYQRAMKLHPTIDDYQADVLIQDDRSRVHAEIEGRSYELEVHESGLGGYVLIANGQGFDCRIDGHPDSGKPIDVIVRATQLSVTLSHPKRLRVATSVRALSD